MKTGKSSSQNQNELSSVCLPYNSKFEWTKDNNNYELIGPDKKENQNFEKCYANVMKVLMNNVNAPVEMRDKKIYAFSYYYDRLEKSKIFDKLNDKPRLSLETIYKRAKSSLFNQLNHQNSIYYINI
jgi:hypothetical protein